MLLHALIHLVVVQVLSAKDEMLSDLIERRIVEGLSGEGRTIDQLKPCIGFPDHMLLD